MTTITESQLADKLRALDHRGACPVTITAFTDTRARKTGNPWSQILKLSRVNGMTCVDYQAAVERQQARDGQPVGFAARPAWYERVGAALGQHRQTGALYLLLKPQRTIGHATYFGRNPNSGALVQVPKAKVEPFLPPKYDAAPSQGTLSAVEWRAYALSHITAISIDGEHYRVRPDGYKTIRQRVPITKRKPEWDEPRSQVPGGYEPPETGCR